MTEAQYTEQLTGSPTQLGDGRWGVKLLTGDASSGDVVLVQTRSGKEFEKRLIALEREYEAHGALPPCWIWSAESTDGDGR